MATMIALVGEQPIPVLLPIRALNPEKILLFCTKTTKRVAHRLSKLLGARAETSLLRDGYDMEGIRDRLRSLIPADGEIVFNLTGGTKIMMLAAYAEASARRAPFVYYQTEGQRDRDRMSILCRFDFDEAGKAILQERRELGSLITLDDYIRAHVGEYETKLSSPGRGADLESAVAEALQGFVEEMKAGVVPSGIKEQAEIDLLVRCGNPVAVLEVKNGGAGSGKRAVDQLTTVAAREYLGTYASRFLITGENMDRRFQSLAAALHIRVVELKDYKQGGRLSEQDALRVRQAIGEVLPYKGKRVAT